jgi:hypothetical protein
VSNRKPIWLGTLTAGVVVALALAVPAFLGSRSAGAVGSVEMHVDCDTSAVGIQSSCPIAVANTAAIPIDVYISNFKGTGTTIGSFGYDLFNPDCVHAAASGNCTDVANNSPSTTNNPDPNGGIEPIAAPAQDPATIPANYGCASPPPNPDRASGNAGTSTSFLSCFKQSGTATAIANGASARISSESFADNACYERADTSSGGFARCSAGLHF